MDSFENIVAGFAGEFPDFQYYLKHAKEIKNHEESHPDIAIECCTSLLQGLSKSICYRLDAGIDRKAFEKSSIEHQVKEAFKLIGDQSDVAEIALPQACSTVARLAGELRNKRGDISHGKAVPKEFQSDASLAKLALDVTEALSRYMLCHLILLSAPSVRYSDNPAFNETLDDAGEPIGSTSYSQLLYRYDFDAYVFQLDEFMADQEAVQ
jgi:Abortive infection C-terminus